MDTGDAEIRDFDGGPVGGEQKILRLDVTVNYAATVSMLEPGANLLDICKSRTARDMALAARPLQIAAGHILEHEVMKDCALEVACCAMSEPANDIGVPDAIEGDRLILKVFDKRPFKVLIDIVLEKNIKGLNDDDGLRRVSRRKYIACSKDLGIAAASELALNVVPFIDSAV
jgi:hypothetical protein